jgi:large subunit ribosomal protein L10
MPNAANVEFVEKFTEEIKSSEHVVVAEYTGLTTEELNDIRAKLAPMGSKCKIVKNRLAKIILNNIGRTGLDSQLKGPSALVYNGTDFAGIGKILFKFSEEHKNLKIKGAHAFGSVMNAQDFKSISSLPGREVLLSTLLARLQSPLQTLMATMNEPLRGLHASLTALAKKKESTPAA